MGSKGETSASRSDSRHPIDELEPTVVVLSRSAGYYNSLVDSSGEPVPDELGLTVWSHDLRGFVAGLRERSIDVVVVQPTPINAEHPILCASFGAEPGECTGSRSELTSSVAELARTQREALAGLDGVSLLDPIAILCPSEACVFEENGVYVWNDEHHITTAYAATKAGAVAPYLDEQPAHPEAVMTASDRERWNERYLEAGSLVDPEAPAGFVGAVDLLPTEGAALDVACGSGTGSVWLALRGLTVIGVDGSDVAIRRAEELAAAHGVGQRCSFLASDLDEGLPPGPQMALVTCHRFSDPSLDQQMIGRLEIGGVLAITVLSEVGGEPGPYRARAGELLERFGELDVRLHLEEKGTATLVGVVAGPQPDGRLD